MSVLIKGMKMPKEGKIIAIYKINSKFYVSQNGELCPIIELPNHGDLIDREAWKKSLIDEGETIGIDGFSIDGLSADDVCYAIENAPVIIPAERREEDDT